MHLLDLPECRVETWHAADITKELEPAHTIDLDSFLKTKSRGIKTTSPAAENTITIALVENIEAGENDRVRTKPIYSTARNRLVWNIAIISYC